MRRRNLPIKSSWNRWEKFLPESFSIVYKNLWTHSSLLIYGAAWTPKTMFQPLIRDSSYRITINLYKGSSYYCRQKVQRESVKPISCARIKSWHYLLLENIDQGSMKTICQAPKIIDSYHLFSSIDRIILSFSLEIPCR